MTLMAGLSRTAAMLKAFADAGFVRVEPPLLHDAATFLDLGGEDIRARLFLTASSNGAELCLRPEYTIPVARLHLASPDAGRPARYCYGGPVFRMRPGSSGELAQAGLESFGEPATLAATADADAQILALTLDAIETAGTALRGIVLGDAGLVAAMLDAVGLPPLWQRRLKRGLEKGVGLDQLLAGAPDAAANRAAAPEHAGLMAALAGSSNGDAHAFVEDLLSIAGIATVGGRSVAEIADRFMSRAAERAAPGFSDERRAVLKRFFAVSGAPDRALSELRALAREADLDLGAALDLFDERAGFIQSQGVDLGRLTFRTAFARNLDYYTGFVFEADGGHPDGPVAGGGRYDRLAQALGAAEPIPAVGAAIWLDRLGGAEDRP